MASVFVVEDDHQIRELAVRAMTMPRLFASSMLEQTSMW